MHKFKRNERLPCDIYEHFYNWEQGKFHPIFIKPTTGCAICFRRFSSCKYYEKWRKHMAHPVSHLGNSSLFDKVICNVFKLTCANVGARFMIIKVSNISLFYTNY